MGIEQGTDGVFSLPGEMPDDFAQIAQYFEPGTLPDQANTLDPIISVYDLNPGVMQDLLNMQLMNAPYFHLSAQETTFKPCEFHDHKSSDPCHIQKSRTEFDPDFSRAGSTGWLGEGSAADATRASRKCTSMVKGEILGRISKLAWRQ
ncbi:hypothetical protein MBM_09877 [Drepanopeziza brunnea f. sp. 'multigermtubi' MB_m1]|uniref:Uncharacterized protein n=2 Tax=Drepanopeziza brunnea f. sp. 'multigermtubi' TaxID=698441 RepID=K1XHT0_MARBU|nr:uncharacterized protein MBM_09877 [Drepanopeziza brunnea f. sp. 'multigermtubi' MB_m1]EKD12014.1 hypothetical protein MBM_09877 [Drepanopeziza brunnea f. sp. 'multigermtubi' MB_m1]